MAETRRRKVNDEFDVRIDINKEGPEIRPRRHSLGQGGYDDVALTPAVVDRLKALRPPIIRLFVQEYFQMMPEPGRYRWEKVDAAVGSVVRTGAVPMLALCMKPKCLFPRRDLGLLVPTSWDAWEDFIQAMTHHFAVDRGWKGMWYGVGNEPECGGGTPYVFNANPAAYAEFYERTARAVLRGDPTARVGGPSSCRPRPFDSEVVKKFVERVRERRLPLHFFSWHMYNMSPEEIGRQVAGTLADLQAAGEPFSSAAAVLGEWNITYACDLQIGEYLQSAFVVDVVSRLIEAGLDYSCYYHIMNTDLCPEKWADWWPPDLLAGVVNGWGKHHHGLHLLEQDGTPSLVYAAFQMLYAMEGKKIAGGRITDSIAYLGSRSEHSVRILLWNYHPERCVQGVVNIKVHNLPAGPISERHFSLSGNLLNTGEALAVRNGQVPMESELRHGSGAQFRKTLVMLPFSVHLLEISWQPNRRAAKCRKGAKPSAPRPLARTRRP